MITVGIECESIERDSYGIARAVRKLLDRLADHPELARTHRFILYFNGQIPLDIPRDNPLFLIRHIGLSRWHLPSSFSVYYYILLPLRLFFDRPNVMYYPNYMLPLIHPWFIPSMVMLTEDVWHEMHNPQLPFRYRLAYNIFARWAAWRATRIVAISHASQAGLTRRCGIAPDRIIVNELAVDMPQNTSTHEWRPEFLYLGQAFGRRHLREALAAFQEVAQKIPDARFCIIGPDKYNPPIIESTARMINRQLGRHAVVWKSHESDEELSERYSATCALVYVSDIEAFGLPPLEALAHGVPAILADTPINHEIYGAHAFFVANSSVDEIARALSAAYTDTDKRAKILSAAPAILARYTWNAHADRFLRSIRNILIS